MLHYLVQWGHMYVIHFGVWMTFLFAADVYKNGMPTLDKLPTMFKTALILSATLSLFSSHSQHYIAHILPKI